MHSVICSHSNNKHPILKRNHSYLTLSLSLRECLCHCIQRVKLKSENSLGQEIAQLVNSINVTSKRNLIIIKSLRIIWQMQLNLTSSFHPVSQEHYMDQAQSRSPKVNEETSRCQCTLNQKDQQKPQNGGGYHNPEAQQTRQQKPNRNRQQAESQNLYYELGEQLPMPKESQGIIYFKQNYEYTHRYKKPARIQTKLKQIIIKFYASEQKCYRNQEINALTIRIQSQKITVQRLNDSKIVANFSDRPLFPQSAQLDQSVLQRRVWVQINKNTNKISVNNDDIQESQQEKTQRLSQPLIPQIQETKLDWKHCQKTYRQIQQDQFNSGQSQLQKPIMRLSSFRIFIKTSKCSLDAKGNRKQRAQNILSLSQHITVKCFGVEAKMKPQLKQNPSILQPEFSQFCSMPPEIRSLYARIKNLDLCSLSGLQRKSQGNSSINEQTIQYSIHSSLTTSYKLLIKGQNKNVPVGILNHMLKVKTNRQFKELVDGKSESKLGKQLYQQIVSKRVGYIRFVVSNGKDVYPAILQIWPPYYCSPIHNHGQAFGLAKVIMGQTRVQNFQDLRIQTSDHPYLKNDYQKGQYTWLSQNSFSSHRVLNLRPITCLTLQAYYDHNQGSDQYFSFIQQKQPVQKKTKQSAVHSGTKQSAVSSKIKQFAVYYPQNDWQNYINKSSIDLLKDRQFIDAVIQCYQVKNKQTGEIDYSFKKFIDIMLTQYKVIQKIIDFDTQNTLNI